MTWDRSFQKQGFLGPSKGILPNGIINLVRFQASCSTNFWNCIGNEAAVVALILKALL
jgi:hypothetical protein